MMLLSAKLILLYLYLRISKLRASFCIYIYFEGKPDNLEFFRYFRTNYFNSIEEFYENFYKILDKDLKTFLKKIRKKIKSIKTKFPFYSVEDIKFRLIRDTFLTKNSMRKLCF